MAITTSEAGGATIEGVAIRYVAVPTGMKSFMLPNGHRTPTELAGLLVRVVDRDGASGLSLLWAQQPQQLPLFEASVRYLSPTLVGRDPSDVAATVAAMRQGASFLGPDGVIAFGISGLEMAIQDLCCRRREINLADALGRTDRPIRAYQTGLMLPSSIDELIAEAERVLSRGITAIKMIVGKPTLDEDVERVRAVKAALPSGAALMVDALQRWDLGQATAAAERFAEFDLVWIEDPLPNHDITSYAELARRSPVPISTGETSFSVDAFERLFDAGLPYVVAELERVGGISGWMNVARLARERSINLLPHIYPHISAQLAAALDQDEVWWEYVPWFDSLLDESFTLVDGHLEPARRPGSGFDPAPDAVEGFAQTPWLTLTA